MIVIAGGLHDTNLTVLLDRLRQRELPHREIRVGPEGGPSLRIDIAANRLEIDGEVLEPTAMFVRQDVFLYPTQDIAAAHAGASNWYSAIRGWALGRPDIRMFNRQTSLRENNKIQNLVEALKAGLRVPETLVSTAVPEAAAAGAWITKPVAGGAYTRLVDEVTDADRAPYPSFFQPRLERPEMRIYKIDRILMGFWLASPDLDYRETQSALLSEAEVPAELGAKLLALCDTLGLEFAAADFMADADGTLHFLEVNSQPMFAAFDRVVEGRLADAIIDRLLDAAPARSATSEARWGATASA
jgi:hypothetical protein